MANSTECLNDNCNNTSFGQRYLNDDVIVFDFNAWDNVELPKEKEKEAISIIERQKLSAVRNPEILKNLTCEKWDQFYLSHTDRFFMNRNWILREFFEINDFINKKDFVRGLDVGCGVGNTTFPLLNGDETNRLFMYCCDFSKKAIEVLRNNVNFEPKNCYPFVWDISSDLTTDIKPNSLDFILCIYVLSAMPPEKHRSAIENLTKLLVPGGFLFIKDYAQYDLTQLRFKSDRFICENFYCRGDGTLVYYFTSDELHEILSCFGLKKVQNNIDKRLIINRAKQIKMYRRWIQCKYKKPLF